MDTVVLYLVGGSSSVLVEADEDTCGVEAMACISEGHGGGRAATGIGAGAREAAQAVPGAWTRFAGEAGL
jgi:hypothetical protein